ncbi:hypothetical protein GIB67_017485 [Kingdonia uniflora]|uniref:Uncharacterized protein n=1 Tax=Kingdonia uniflora TaxID=39325 RepID=A0A7J7M4H9_9MAGN|nr:hypothetical protein GIB67_017485 [Kingdonia uniflora]
MDSDEDDQFFSPPKHESSSPIPQRRLKRLKRSSDRVVLISSIHRPVDEIPLIGGSDSRKEDDEAKIEPPKTPDSENLVDPIQLVSEDTLDSVNEDLGEKLEKLDSDLEVREEIEDHKKEESLKKSRGDSDGVEEEKKNSKKRKSKSIGEDSKLESFIHAKRRLEMERKAHIDQLHAESQRLFRETRDAEFKPALFVQKPLSSVLEKIRKRKLEVSKKQNYPRDIILDIYPEEAGGIEKPEAVATEPDKDAHAMNVESSHLDITHLERSSDSTSPSGQQENIISKIAFDEESKVAFRIPLEDTQDLYDSVSSDEEVVLANSSRPLEEVLAPSLVTMNLMLDSAPPEDVYVLQVLQYSLKVAYLFCSSSDEEEDGKENVDPYQHKPFNESFFPKGDPVKAFLDDEAEEEDDSDIDPMQVQENEEDEENGEDEEFNDLIVTGYKEKPIDNERRDKLHQKWLEQQDAAATDNVLQRLKCGGSDRDPTVFEVGEENEEFGYDSLDESVDDLFPIARIKTKKLKEMIPRLFTDNDDPILSDDEETEKDLVRQRLIEKAEEHTSFLSPAEDESSREVFGLIKKLNIAPDTKKKTKQSSFLEALITGGKSNSSSKSSFLGRVRNTCLTSSAHKQGSRNFRSFVFGRDDSNSRSGISTADTSDTVEKENAPKKYTPAKFSSSQLKRATQSTTATVTETGSSLLEILRRPSDHCRRGNNIGQTQAGLQFAAFKSGKKSVKIETRR